MTVEATPYNLNRPARDINLTGTSYAVLGLVESLGEATPYDLKAALEGSVANFWPVQHTTFYGEPERLANAGYLSLDQETGGRRRKHYRITESGREALAGWIDTPDAKPPQLRDEHMLKIFLGADATPLLEARLEWHRAKQEELESNLDCLGTSAIDSEGARRALHAGIAYNRLFAETIELFLRGGSDAFEIEAQPRVRAAVSARR